MDTDMIRLLLAIDEKKSLYQIAAEVDIDSVTFKRTLLRLLEHGIVQDIGRPTAILERTFIQALQRSLREHPMSGNNSSHLRSSSTICLHASSNATAEPIAHK